MWLTSVRHESPKNYIVYPLNSSISKQLFIRLDNSSDLQTTHSTNMSWASASARHYESNDDMLVKEADMFPAPMEFKK